MMTPTPKDELFERLQMSATRRGFLFAGAMFLVGCGTKRVTSTLPSPIWTGQHPVVLEPEVQSVVHSIPEAKMTDMPRTIQTAIPRSVWAKGDPIPRNMKPMLPMRYITIHHDGMTRFTETSKASAASRLETIRKSHLRRDGGRWGDIGYHFAIDPAGRLWEGRSLHWQGAHVKARNEGNIGVVVLGNYEIQSVNRAQTAEVDATIALLMKKFSIPLTRVRTHQEWAATACPGKSLQRYMVLTRNRSLKKV